MNAIGQRMMQWWVGLGPRYMPFADAATPDVPLNRLLRLSLFQVSVGMALVLVVGTLNRVMIVELGVPAAIVAVMISLPVLFAPFRALIGFRSDTHRSALGWRRVPFIWQGTLVQFGGLSIMPFALLVLSGGGEASSAPAWVGQLAAGLAFLLVGAGLHTTQTAGLALATDLVPPESHPKVVGLMYVMLLAGMVVSGLVFGAFLRDFSPARLVQVIQAAAVVTLALNLVALWKQEARRPNRRPAAATPPADFQDAWRRYAAEPHAVRHLAALALGTMAFSMQDILLEPYGGEILGLSVGGTTLLTATLAAGTLVGFILASRLLGRGTDPFRLAHRGALLGLPAFACVLAAAPLQSSALFVLGAFLVGWGAGLFGHATLTASMSLAPAEQRGLALGTWGAVQATAAGVAIAAGGVLRDGVGTLAAMGSLGPALTGPETGYGFVYGLEMLLLIIACTVLAPLARSRT